VIIDDLDVEVSKLVVGPLERDPPPVVDGDAELSCSIA